MVYNILGVCDERVDRKPAGASLGQVYPARCTTGSNEMLLQCRNIASLMLLRVYAAGIFL